MTCIPRERRLSGEGHEDAWSTFSSYARTPRPTNRTERPQVAHGNDTFNGVISIPHHGQQWRIEGRHTLRELAVNRGEFRCADDRIERDILCLLFFSLPSPQYGFVLRASKNSLQSQCEILRSGLHKFSCGKKTQNNGVGCETAMFLQPQKILK
jgi:hypothetical protein